MIGVTNEFKEFLMIIKNKFKKSYDSKLKDFLDPYFIYKEMFILKNNILRYFMFVRKPKVNLVQRNY